VPTGRSSRGEASLAACRSQAAPEKENAGSMSRPGIEFVDDLQIVCTVAVLAWKDGELFAGSEKRDWNKSKGELEGVVLRKPKSLFLRGSRIQRQDNGGFSPAAERHAFSSVSTR
jgi:hypothetical protein